MTMQGPFRSAERALLFSGGVRFLIAGVAVIAGRGHRGDLAGHRAAEVRHVSARASVRAAARGARGRGRRSASGSISTARASKRGSCRAPAPTPAPLLIYAHGNGELIDIQTRSVDALRAAGIAVLLVEYPGYGRSGGSPRKEASPRRWSPHTTGRRTIRASIRAHRRLRPLAGRRRRRATRGRAAAGGAGARIHVHQHRRDWCARRASRGWLVVNDFDTRAVLAKYPGPVLILHGTQRSALSRSRMRMPCMRRRRDPTLHLQDCGHNDCPPQWELVLSFLAQNGVFSKPVSGGLTMNTSTIFGLRWRSRCRAALAAHRLRPRGNDRGRRDPGRSAAEAGQARQGDGREGAARYRRRATGRSRRARQGREQRIRHAGQSSIPRDAAKGVRPRKD